MKQTWLPQGHSDPLTYTCTCLASTSPPHTGQVLLFYRYFSADPPLPKEHHVLSQTPSNLAAYQTQLCRKYNLSGKIRVASEGFNITIGGTTAEIEAYIDECLTHWSFSGLGLNTDSSNTTVISTTPEPPLPRRINEFFKPTPGCRCVFGGQETSVKLVTEITPMGITNYLPSDWGRVQDLSPSEFHERCWEERGGKELVLLDVRNFYESRIGYFVDPRRGGEPALRPGIRRFSQWPGFVRRVLMAGDEGGGRGGRDVMAYCTGGIRCEKGVRYLEEKMERRDGDRVCALKGGIAAYLSWMDGEIRGGRKTVGESLFRGRNYVFDGRGSVGLEGTGTEGEGEGEGPVAVCHCCGRKCDRLSKCWSRGCHLVLVVCGECEVVGDVRCCRSCKSFDEELGSDEGRRREICDCEREREEKLWGGIDSKVDVVKSQGWRTERRKRERGEVRVDVRIKTIAS